MAARTRGKDGGVSGAEDVLRKLRRKGPNTPAGRLAALVVDDLLACSLDELVQPAEIARRSMDMLSGLASSEQLAPVVQDRVSWWLDRLGNEPGAAGDWLSDDAARRLGELLERPFPLDPDLTIRWLDHEAMRNLVRRVLRETLSTFVKRMRPSMPDSRLLSGVKRRAGKLARLPRERVGGLGDGMLGAMGGEVERQMERRVGEFVDSAVGGVLRRIADHLADPAHEEQFGRMRAAAVRVGLETSNRATARELAKIDREALSAFVVASIASMAHNERVEAWIAALVEAEVSETTVGSWLDERGIRDTWSDWAREVVADRTRALAHTAVFATWLETLLS